MPETFASLLQSIMDRNNLSQRELARRAEIDYVSLCRMLKPYYKFRPGKTIARITKAVGCTEAERIQLYRVAGLMPEEMLAAFCEDDIAADNFRRATEAYLRHKRKEYMSEPKRIQRKRVKGWRMPENTVSITRPSKYGNPFPVDVHGMLALPMFEDNLKIILKVRPDFLAPLRGKNLACFCAAGQPCHGDILLRYANK